MGSVRELVRMARMIQAAYLTRRKNADALRQFTWQPLERWMDEARRLKRWLDKAQAHGWRLAAEELQRRLSGILHACGEAIAVARSECLAKARGAPSLLDLVAELQQVYEEFDVAANPRSRVLAIQTDAIVLEEIHLGPFLVRLHWSRLAHSADVGCFEIVALKPNVAGGDDGVTHPHVRNGKLCAGDATVPVQQALQDGRLADAFHLVRAVLETFNPSSAYAQMADWNGVACWVCGLTTSEDSRTFCEGCDRDVCEDCISSCKHCDRSRCSSCIGQCDVCDENCCRLCLTKSAVSEVMLCKDCLQVCEGCGAEVAPEEFDAAAKRCPACKSTQPMPLNETPELLEGVSR